MMHILNLTIVFNQNLSGSSVSSDRVINFAIESYLLAIAVIQYPRERPMKNIAADSIKLSDKAVAYRAQHNNTIVMIWGIVLGESKLVTNCLIGIFSFSSSESFFSA